MEIRRAKRKKKWLIDGNIIPLSTMEKRAILNKEYRFKQKQKKENEAIISFKLNYKNEMYNLLNSHTFTHKGCLTHKDNITMYRDHKDASFILQNLMERNKLSNYFFQVEYEQNHVHLHYIVNSQVKTNQLSSHIHTLFNRYKIGNNWLKEIKDNEDLEASIKYFVDKLNVDNTARQSQIDYWYFNVKDVKLTAIHDFI